MLHRVCISLLAILVLLLIAPTQPVFACTTEPHDPPPLKDRVELADTIFEGVVTSVIGDDYEQTAIIKVIGYLKGGQNAPEWWYLKALETQERV